MESSFKDEIKKRAKAIGLEVIKLLDELPSKQASWVLSKQL